MTSVSKSTGLAVPVRSPRADRASDRNARLNCRVSSTIKLRAEEAASLLGQSITDFTEQALAEKAEAILSQFHRIELSERDFARFVRAINQPPEPTPALLEAAADYRRLRERDPEGNW
ncbi:MAG: DUF1778 domain-containing protein [Chloroflexi bacterium]|nr:DUF1778 domain-containing protein [Chloroflexota bacterium]